MANIVILAGAVENPSMRYTQKNDPILNFTVKTVETYNGKEFPSWHKCSIFGDRANDYGHIDDGDMVIVHGSLKHRSWEKDDGTKAYMTEVGVKSLEVIGGEEPTNNAEPAAPEVNEDDLPF